MYVDVVPNRHSPPAILLRESVREGPKIRKRTLANLSDWPAPQVEALRRVLKGESLVPVAASLNILRSLPHGHVAAVLGTLRRLGLDQLVERHASRRRELVVALIVARILDPQSKLATARGLDPETSDSSLAEVLSLGSADEDDLYEAMDWLVEQQTRIEDRLAKKHLAEGSLVLYDLSSTYFEGRHCPLARWGRPHDGPGDKLQIVFGVLTNGEGCPVAVEVFEGNTADPKTVAAQVSKLRERFGLKQLVLVGDRGVLTSARLREDLQSAEGIAWITALRAPQIQKLVQDGSLQLSLFDQRDLAEIHDPAFPGERLVVCRNPLLAEERARKRTELLAATERELEKIVTATRRERQPLQGKEKIGLRVGKVLGRFKMGKHFTLQISEDRFSYQRQQEQIAEEAALDGIYVIRTSVPAERLSAEQVVRCYKSLSSVERVFRTFKGMDLKVRPIHHRLADRVRAHFFLCLLAYYVEWHMRRALAPMLFQDDDPLAAEAQRSSVVAPAQRSVQARRKARTKRTDSGHPVHSFHTLLQDLKTLSKNRVQMEKTTFDLITTPSPVQQRAFELLAVSYRL